MPSVFDNLTFNVAQLLKEPIGATRTGQVVAGLFGLLPELGQTASTAPEREVGSARSRAEDQQAAEPALIGSVRLMHTQGGVLVQGKLHAQATLSCSRCLEPVGVPLDVEEESRQPRHPAEDRSKRGEDRA
jgi:hypothetical protein